MKRKPGKRKMRFAKYKALRNLLVVLGTIVAAWTVLTLSTSSAVGSAPRGKQLEMINKSPNYQDGKFVNKLPMEQPGFFSSLKEWVKGKENTTPDEEIPVVERTGADFETPPESGLRITWIGHSTSLIEIDGARLLTDPVWSKRTSPFSWVGPKRFFKTPIAIENLPALDAVLISHDHFDHLDKDTVTRLAPSGVKFVMPLGVGARLRGWDIPDDQIVELDWWESVELAGLTVTATPSRHFSGRSLVMADRDETLWSGFAMNGPTHRVYYSGDTGMFDGFKKIGEKLGPFDATLIEVGAYNHMWADFHLGPEQAMDAFEQVRGGLMIPVHWATFDLALHAWTEPAERLLTAAAKKNTPLAIPKPGQFIEPASPPELVKWWPNLPWDTQEQHPIVSSGLAKAQ